MFGSAAVTNDRGLEMSRCYSTMDPSNGYYLILFFAVTKLKNFSVTFARGTKHPKKDNSYVYILISVRIVPS